MEEEQNIRRMLDEETGGPVSVSQHLYCLTY